MATKSQELLSCGCIAAAEDDEPIFVLRAKDVLAPALVESWSYALAVLVGDAAPKVVQARQVVKDMREWQKANGSKIPD